jgi:hypothetical protein
MNDTPNMYCKLFVDSTSDENQLLALIASITSGTIESKTGTVLSADFELYLDENDDFDETRRLQGEDQFLFYRYYLDVEPTENAPRERYVNAVGNLLEGLWRSGYKAVAACDFEGELPRSGGYHTSTTE